MNRELVRGHLDTLVLAALERGPSHGYAIIQELRLRSGGTFDLQEGSLYPSLHRLEAATLVASDWTTVTGRRRRVYRLTRRGRRELVERATAWRAFSAAMDGALAPVAQ